jgi:hypothetical protein
MPDDDYVEIVLGFGRLLLVKRCRRFATADINSDPMSAAAPRSDVE